jgi:energy-coupling factor transport system permease protein
MLNDIMLGQYFPGNSLVHRLDPRTKIICTLLFISSIFLAESFAAYGLIGVFILSITFVAGIPAVMMLRSVRPLWVILVLTLGIQVFTTPGTIIYSWHMLTITKEGVRQGSMMALRLIYLITLSSLLTFTTSPIALTDGIERLLKPFKKIGLPAHELAMMMTIALRFIPTLLEETDRIMKAQQSRGADFASGNLIKRAKNMIPLLVPLFISAFRRADELAIAMESRCYRGGDFRTRMKQLKMSGIDWGAYGVIFLVILILAFMKYKISL